MDHGSTWIAFLLAVLGGLAAEALGLIAFALNRWLVGALAAAVHLYTVTIASSLSIPAAVATLFMPGFAQAYWIGHVWSARGTFWHPLTCMCAVLMVSIAIDLAGRRAFAARLDAVDRRA